MIRLSRTITTRRIVARFDGVCQAEAAKREITRMMRMAESEVAALFERQNGVAESAEVAQIYERHGFTNDSGWRQIRPLFTVDEELYWELPEGMPPSEAASLLAAFGANAIIGADDDDDLLKLIPHPATLFLFDVDEDWLEDDEDMGFLDMPGDKKILH